MAWWKFGNAKQEGAAVTPAQQAVIVQRLASLLPSFRPLTIVTTNWTANTVPVTYKLSNFASLGTSAQGYRTSATQNLANVGTVAVSGGAFVGSLPPNSVTTWVIGGANYAPAMSTFNDSSLVYSSSNCGTSWCSGSQSGAYASDNHWSSQVGSTCSLTFTGTQARVYGARACNQGIAAFSVDNRAETDVDLYASARTDNQLTYVTPTLPLGTHTIKCA